MTSKRKIGIAAVLAASALALAGWGAAEGLLETDDALESQAHITEVGELGDGERLFEHELDGETRHFVSREVAVSEEPAVIESNVVGELGDGRVIVEERTLRVADRAEFGLGDDGIGDDHGVGLGEETTFETGVDTTETVLPSERDVIGGETAGIEGGQGEFEPNDQESPTNELIAP